MLKMLSVNTTRVLFTLLGVTHCEDQTQKKKKITETSSAMRVKGNSPATSQASSNQGWGWCLEGGSSIEAMCSNWKPATQRHQRVRCLIINACGTTVSIKINHVQISPETLTPSDASGKTWSTGTFPAAQRLGPCSLTAGAMGSIPGWGTEIPCVTLAQPKEKLSTRGKKGAQG